MSEPPIDLDDVQGTILRGYRVDMARHFILEITDPAGAKGLIGSMVDGGATMPQITTSAHWGPKPASMMNLGFSRAGLARLGLTADQLATFDMAFQRGATDPATASIVGDVGASAPDRWIGGLGDGPAVHAVLSLWVTDDPAVLEALTATLRAAFVGRIKELSAHDARALDGNRVHFGYRDSIAQPTVAGAPKRKNAAPDGQAGVNTGEFLLGHPNASDATYEVKPAELSKNSSYSAFRILEQDVEGFEKFLVEYSAGAKVAPETLAAKVCGRWRNGNPLELMPDSAGTPLPMEKINDFTYGDDVLGLKCPIGSHLRRNNPRDARVVGTDAAHHRIFRRAMPYGPEYDPAHPDPAARGLVGHFINASIMNQFEFLMGQWDNTPNFIMSAPGPDPSCAGNAVFNISGADVFLGVNDPATSSFTLAGCGKKGAGNTIIHGFERLIATKGGVYCFLPSISGLKYLAGLAAPPR